MVVMRAALLASLVAVVACDVGEVPINGGGGGGDVDAGGDPQAAAMFAANIKPLADAKGCTSGGAAGTCHGNVQPPVLTSYESLTATSMIYVKKPSASNKLIVGPASLNPTDNKHQNVVYFDATQKATISAWIDQYGAP